MKDPTGVLPARRYVAPPFLDGEILLAFAAPAKAYHFAGAPCAYRTRMEPAGADKRPAELVLVCLFL